MEYFIKIIQKNIKWINSSEIQFWDRSLSKFIKLFIVLYHHFELFILQG